MISKSLSKGGINARWLAMRCKEPVFWKFLSSEFRMPVSSENEAVTVVKTYGGVTSRAEFDTKPDAINRFHEGIRRPFSHFMSSEAA